MSERYAVYVVIVEDSAASDERLASHVEAMERIGGDMDWTEAEDAMLNVEHVNEDKA